MLTLPDETREQLYQARSLVADEQATLDATEATRAPLLAERAKIDAQLAALDVKAAKRRERVAEAERALSAAEDAALADYMLADAAEAITENAANPRANQHRVIERVNRVRRSVRSDLDWPVHLGAYVLPPLIEQAFALVPIKDPLHLPITGSYSLPYETRRKHALAEYESLDDNQSPSQAA